MGNYIARVRFESVIDCVTQFKTATEAINDCLRMTDKDGYLRPFIVTCDGETVSEWRWVKWGKSKEIGGGRHG